MTDAELIAYFEWRLEQALKEMDELMQKRLAQFYLDLKEELDNDIPPYGTIS